MVMACRTVTQPRLGSRPACRSDTSPNFRRLVKWAAQLPGRREAGSPGCQTSPPPRRGATGPRSFGLESRVTWPTPHTDGPLVMEGVWLASSTHAGLPRAVEKYFTSRRMALGLGGGGGGDKGTAGPRAQPGPSPRVAARRGAWAAWPGADRESMKERRRQMRWRALAARARGTCSHTAVVSGGPRQIARAGGVPIH